MTNGDPSARDSILTVKLESRQANFIRQQAVLHGQYEKQNQECFDFPLRSMPPLLQHLVDESLGLEYPAYVYGAVCFAITLATQGKLIIASPSGRCSDTLNSNLFLEIIGQPGTGKSTVIAKYLAPLRNLDNIRYRQHIAQNEEAKIERENLLREKNRLSRRFQKMSDDDPERNNLNHRIADLDRHINRKLPSAAPLIFNDATRSGVLKRLVQNNGTAALVNDEAGSFFKKVMALEPGLFSKLYDGRDYSRESDDFTLDFPAVNFSMLVAVQNGVAAELYAKHRATFIDSGLRSRMLTIINPESATTQPRHLTSSGCQYFAKYSEIIKLIYERGNPSDQIHLSLSENTVAFCNGLLEQLRDASKNFRGDGAMQARTELHLVKLAASFALLNNPLAIEISKTDLMSAAHAMSYHLKMNDILLNHESRFNYEGIAEAAEGILEVMKRRANENQGVIELKWLRTRIQYDLRKVRIFQPMLDYLVDIGRIKLSSQTGPLTYVLVTSPLQLMNPR